MIETVNTISTRTSFFDVFIVIIKRANTVPTWSTHERHTGKPLPVTQLCVTGGLDGLIQTPKDYSGTASESGLDVVPPTAATAPLAELIR